MKQSLQNFGISPSLISVSFTNAKIQTRWIELKDVMGSFVSFPASATIVALPSILSLAYIIETGITNTSIGQILPIIAAGTLPSVVSAIAAGAANNKLRCFMAPSNINSNKDKFFATSVPGIAINISKGNKAKATKVAVQK
jgi:hypothetical protein